MSAGSTVSWLSNAKDPALFVCAANLLIDSVLALSRNVASSSWNEVFSYSEIGIATAEPGKSYRRAFLEASTSLDRGEASNASNKTELPLVEEENITQDQRGMGASRYDMQLTLLVVG
jgi:hypothetical protein